MNAPKSTVQEGIAEAIDLLKPFASNGLNALAVEDTFEPLLCFLGIGLKGNDLPTVSFVLFPASFPVLCVPNLHEVVPPLHCFVDN